jgi:hypothetical protein
MQQQLTHTGGEGRSEGGARVASPCVVDFMEAFHVVPYTSTLL